MPWRNLHRVKGAEADGEVSVGKRIPLVLDWRNTDTEEWWSETRSLIGRSVHKVLWVGGVSRHVLFEAFGFFLHRFLDLKNCRRLRLVLKVTKCLELNV